MCNHCELLYILFASCGPTLVKNELNLFAISALSVIRCSSCFRLIKFVLLVGDLFGIELIAFHVCCISFWHLSNCPVK